MCIVSLDIFSILLYNLDMQIRRKLLTVLEKHLDDPEIIVVTGMRRVGKTTLLRMLYEEIQSPNKVFLDIENPIDQKVFEESDYNNIWSNLRAHGISNTKRVFIFLDEIQAMPPIIKAVKYLYDHYEVKFFLTGSSSFYLKNLFGESLAGRKFIFELFPLDFEEFLRFKNQQKEFAPDFKNKDKMKNKIVFEKIIKFFDEYLEYGGFPRVALESDPEKKKLALEDIFKSYFEKDVKILADFREINAFRDLILLLLARTGAKLDISKISQEIGVSRATVYAYFSFLEGTYFLKLISPFSRSSDREVSGAKKAYVCDTGIVNHLAKAGQGEIFENAVFNNIRRYGKINYYQRRTGAEIDFIINEKVGIEAKLKGVDYDLRRLRKLANALGLKENYLVSKEFSEKAGIIPAVEL